MKQLNPEQRRAARVALFDDIDTGRLSLGLRLGFARATGMDGALTLRVD